MAALAKPLVYAALLSFLVAVVTSFTGPVADLPPETFSHASSNLALIAIGLAMLEKGQA